MWIGKVLSISTSLFPISLLLSIRGAEFILLSLPIWSCIRAEGIQAKKALSIKRGGKKFSCDLFDTPNDKRTKRGSRESRV